MIRIENLSKSFDHKVVLDDFSYDFEAGAINCILGPSGCGKTTLLHLLGRLLVADSGTITGLENMKRSFVFQENRLLPWRTSLANLTVTGADKERAEDVLHRVGLRDELHTYPAELSGGMARRLAIARAFAHGGDCFFLDEPLQGLDEETRERVLLFMREELQGKTAFLITHDKQEAKALTDRIYIAGGPPFQILNWQRIPQL